MKKYLIVGTLAVVASVIAIATACQRTDAGTKETESVSAAENTEEATTTIMTEETGDEEDDTGEASEMKMTINGAEVSVAWEDNDSVREIMQALPLTIEMSMYGGWEQVGSLGRSFTRNDVQQTATSGDIMLYSGNQLVVFYGDNSWAYTKLGKIQGMSADEITRLLSAGDVTITLTR